MATSSLLLFAILVMQGICTSLADDHYRPEPPSSYNEPYRPTTKGPSYNDPYKPTTKGPYYEDQYRQTTAGPAYREDIRGYAPSCDTGYHHRPKPYYHQKPSYPAYQEPPKYTTMYQPRYTTTYKPPVKYDYTTEYSHRPYPTDAPVYKREARWLHKRSADAQLPTSSEATSTGQPTTMPPTTTEPRPLSAAHLGQNTYPQAPTTTSATPPHHPDQFISYDDIVFRPVIHEYAWLIPVVPENDRINYLQDEDHTLSLDQVFQYQDTTSTVRPKTTRANIMDD